MFAAITTLTLAFAAVEDPKFTEAAEKELKKFEAKWKPEKIVANGVEEKPPPDAADMLLEFKGRKIMLGEKHLFNITALDPSVDPKIIDMKALDSMGAIMKDTVYESIYKFDGDHLVIAIYVGGAKNRPIKFESEKDSNVVVVTFKKEKK